MFRERRHCGVKKKTTPPPGFPFDLIAVDPSVRGDHDPAALVPERAHPRAVFGVSRKSIGQMDDLVALRAEQDIQRMGEMRG